jgi:hypothetical protein
MWFTDPVFLCGFQGVALALTSCQIDSYGLAVCLLFACACAAGVLGFHLPGIPCRILCGTLGFIFTQSILQAIACALVTTFGKSTLGGADAGDPECSAPKQKNRGH